MAVGGSAITKGAIDRLATALRQALSSDDPAFRKAYLRLFVGQIVVSDAEVRMKGPIGALAAATMNGGLPPADRRGSQFYPEWRPVGDSNPCYRRERAANSAGLEVASSDRNPLDEPSDHDRRVMGSSVARPRNHSFGCRESVFRNDQHQASWSILSVTAGVRVVIGSNSTVPRANFPGGSGIFLQGRFPPRHPGVRERAGGWGRALLISRAGQPHRRSLIPSS